MTEQTHDGTHDDECFICGTRAMKIRDEVKEKLLSGAGYWSEFNRPGYHPPVRREDYAHAVATIAAMARKSDALAQVAARILPKLNLYGTDPQLEAAIFNAAAGAIRDGYDDVIGRAGPEAGRYRDHQRRFTLAECVMVRYWVEEAAKPFQSSVPGVGWAVSAIADELHLSEYDLGPLRTAERIESYTHLTHPTRTAAACDGRYHTKLTRVAEDVTCEKCRVDAAKRFIRREA